MRKIQVNNELTHEIELMKKYTKLLKNKRNIRNYIFLGEKVIKLIG